MQKTLTTLTICGFIVANLLADSLNNRTITIGNTTAFAYREDASDTNRNIFAIPRDGKIILINAGMGGEDGFLKHFIADFNNPEDVSAILLTNMNYDNIGGLVSYVKIGARNGGFLHLDMKAVFPNAKIYISKSENELRNNENINNTAVSQTRHFYADRIITFDFDTEVLPGITAIEAGGQTPGNTIFATRDIMFIGDFGNNVSGMDDGSGALALIEMARKATQGDEQVKQQLIKSMGLENSLSHIHPDWIERLAANTNLETRATQILETKRERERLERERREKPNR